MKTFLSIAADTIFETVILPPLFVGAVYATWCVFVWLLQLPSGMIGG